MDKTVPRFNKYEKQGAYHWRLYEQGNRDYKKRIDGIISLFNESEGSLLDIGCGDGLVSCKLAETNNFITVLGIDNNMCAIKLAQAKCASLISLGKLQFSHKAYSGLSKRVKYDYVLAHEVIEHVPDPVSLLKRIHYFANKFAIITTPNKQYNKPDRFDHNLWTRKEFEILFKPYKYSVIFKGKFICIKLEK